MIWPLSLFYSGDADIAGKSDRPVSSEATKPSSPSPMDLLQHFESPCVPLPPSARVGDPKLRQREGQPLSIWQLGKMGIFAAMKGQSPLTVICLAIPNMVLDVCTRSRRVQRVSGLA